MTKTEKITVWGSTAVMTATGVAIGWMEYMMTPSDTFAVVNHPWQPQMLSAHVVVSPIVLFLLGWTFSNHMLPKYRFGNGKNRRTGVGAMLLIVPMTLSAYLLQISVDERLRQAMAIAHWISSGVFVLAYAAHLIYRRD